MASRRGSMDSKGGASGSESAVKSTDVASDEGQTEEREGTIGDGEERGTPEASFDESLAMADIDGTLDSLCDDVAIADTDDTADSLSAGLEEDDWGDFVDRQALADIDAILNSTMDAVGRRESLLHTMFVGDRFINFYDPEKFRAKEGPKQLPFNTATLHHCFGFEGSRRSNIQYIADHLIIHVCGNTVQTLDLKTMEQSYLWGLDGKGIGAVAVHPSQRFFAVCEKGVSPNVYVYEYPSLRLYKVLKGGTENAYSTALFSSDGLKLATVGSFPDFWLTLWNWEAEKIILRSKAFSQEVFRISFSEFFPGQLITSGTGHIRFWKMALTFTGLKLQGEIGKFGQTPLSDVAGYAELPDGKVLSGTESGSLLMWDGGLIKCEIRKPEGVPCHQGMIEEVFLDRDMGQIVTAGVDGYVKFWSFEAIDAADTIDEKSTVEIEPVEEICIGAGVRIKSLLREPDHWLIQDEGGSLLRVQLPTYRPIKLLDFHMGSISAIDCSPISHHAVTGGSDGTIRLFDYRRKTHLHSRRFNAAVTTLSWLPKHVESSGRTVISGFADGVVRVLSCSATSWDLRHVLKPHKAAVNAIAVTHDGQVVASASADATVFFFDQVTTFGPIGFVELTAVPSCMSWSEDGSRLLFGCVDGSVFEMSRPNALVDTTKTFRLDITTRVIDFKRPVIAAPKKKQRRQRKQPGHPASSRPAADEPSSSAGSAAGDGVAAGGGAADGGAVPGKPTVGVGVGGGENEGEETEAAGLEGEEPTGDGQEGKTGDEPPAESRGSRRASLELLTDGSKAPPAGKGGPRSRAGSVSEQGGGKDGDSQLQPDAPGDTNENKEAAGSHSQKRRSSLRDKPAGDEQPKGGGRRDSTTKGGGTGPAKGEVSKEEGEENEDKVPFPVRAILFKPRSSGKSFYLTLGGRAKGVLYECNTENGNVIATVPLHSASAVSSLRLTRSIRFLLTGYEDGVVRLEYAPWIQPQPELHLWEKCLHDGFSGTVNGVATSFDDTFLLSVASDGSFFVHSLTLDGTMQREGETGTLLRSTTVAPPAAEGLPVYTDAMEDIVSVTEYSMEDSKQKKEHDNLIAAANLKKASVREQLAKLREEFAQLIEENMSKPPREQLPPEEFDIDSGLRGLIETQTQEKIAMAEKELQWESEKKSIALAKLRRWFLDDVEVERVVLRAFMSKRNVTTFRTAKLSAQMLESIENAHKMLEEEERQREIREEEEKKARELVTRTFFSSIILPQPRAHAGEAATQEPSPSPTNPANSSSPTSNPTNVEERDTSPPPSRSNQLHSPEEQHKSPRPPSAGPKLSKQEQRRLQREKRQEEWAAFMKTKPSDDYQNPDDVASMEWARTHMGDFKLKSDSNYILPEHKRENAVRKWQQMVLLQEAIHSHKMDFNKKLLALRDVKAKVVESISKDNARITEINIYLKMESANQSLLKPQTYPDEYPERRDIVTREDLIAFNKEQRKAGKDGKKGKGASLLGGFSTAMASAQSPTTGGGGGGEEEDMEEEPPSVLLGGSIGKMTLGKAGPSSPTVGTFPAGAGAWEKASAATLTSAGDGSVAGGGRTSPAPASGTDSQPHTAARPWHLVKNVTVMVPSGTTRRDEQEIWWKGQENLQMSELEFVEQEMVNRRLKHEKSKLQERVNTVVNAFDEALEDLRRRKFRLEADLKNADLRMLVYYRELALLKEFGKQDAQLQSKYSAKVAERSDIMLKLADNEEKIENKKQIFDKQSERKQAVVANFDAVVDANHPFREQLSKIFYRRIKRSKKKQRSNTDNADDDSEDSDDLDDVDEGRGDEDMDDDDDEEEVCPPGCDSGLYEKVCELRERKLDQDELINEIQKTLDTLKKEREGLHKKQKNIEAAVKGVEKEMEDFEKEKQSALNQIDVVVTLKMHQIEYLVDGVLPSDLTHALVFSTTALQGLKERIRELITEKAELRKQQRDLKRYQASLLKDRKAKQARIGELEARAHDVQMLKFGQVIDLELLDRVNCQKGSDELKDELTKQSAQHAKEIAHWNQRIHDAGEQLAKLTQENTACLEKAADLTQLQRSLESVLNATQTTLMKDPSLTFKKEQEERDKLLHIVHAQAAEIESLKTEIAALRRKGGNLHALLAQIHDPISNLNASPSFKSDSFRKGMPPIKAAGRGK
ncbi:hypothetical protein CBR_g58401 [Chara braunii]|uniref:Cilia- and flagella-associated protein 44 n=1 Tax=Chara braunii TaxID=69332 RepID=A0A388MEQ2_CHABU|nr:hypothetical protein CBR_g58401 [Chara braunii]|eukprot:GBG93046.1 hypothetical protein CBR_g58401 [Chara braunii]